MLEGLYSAAAGMAAQQQRIDGVSNDLANASTTGYKHVRVGFRDLLYNAQGGGAGPTVLAGAGAAAGFIGRSQEQGALQTTDQPLDVAIQGPGFFQVKRPDGSLALTRDGSLRLDDKGQLVTSSGAKVQPAITLPAGVDPSRISIGPDGTVLAAGRQVGRIELVTVRSPQQLQPVGDNAFLATPESGATRPAPAATQLTQGALEMSNTDMADAMVQMIESQRAFQLTSKAIQTQDQMWEIANGVKR